MCTVEFREGGGYNNIYTLKDGTVITKYGIEDDFDISNHLDNTYEFKHTFGKNEDGSIYWISTEKVN